MKKFVGLSLCLLLALPGCLPRKSGDVLASFDGTVITKDDFLKRISNLPKELQGVAQSRKKEFVEEIAGEHFLYKEAKKRGIGKQSDVRELMEAAERKILISKLVEIEVDKKIKIEPEDAKKYYDTHQEEFMTPLLLRASHILVAGQAEAEEIKKKLDAGADFEEMARTRSQDGTAIRGGDIGFFQKGQLIPEFEETAFKMSKGQVSPVFKTQFGFHVLKLTDRAEPSLRDFKMVKSLIEKQLWSRQRAKMFKQFVEKIRAGSKININEKALEALSVSTSQSG
jgi:peptidyl-prolyl cis-trans isomerase C